MRVYVKPSLSISQPPHPQEQSYARPIVGPDVRSDVFAVEASYSYSDGWAHGGSFVERSHPSRHREPQQCGVVGAERPRRSVLRDVFSP